MDTGHFEVTFPQEILPLIGNSANEMALSSKALYLYPFIKNEILSYGRVANILGISKWELIKIYGDYGIPYIDMDMEELEQELVTIDRFRGIIK